MKLNSHNMDHCSPTRVRIAIYRIQHCLRYCLEQVFWFQIWFPKSLSRTIQLCARCARYHKVLGKIQASNEICSSNERFDVARRRLGDTRYDRLNEVRAKAVFVQSGRHEVSKSLWLYLSLFFDGVHIHPETKSFSTKKSKHTSHKLSSIDDHIQSCYVRRQTRQAEVDSVRYRKYLGNDIKRAFLINDGLCCE